VVLDGIRHDDATSYCICGRVNTHNTAFRTCRFELVSLSVTSNEANPRGINNAINTHRKPRDVVKHDIPTSSGDQEKANAQSENGIDSRVEVLNPKKNKHIDQLNIKTMDYSLYQSHQKQLLPLTKNWAVAELQVSYKQKNRTGVFANSGDMAYRVLRHMWDKSLINIQEQFCVLFLNNHLEVLGFRAINTGTSTSCTVDINLIISCALLCRANNVILAHNHTSGSLKYSKGDFDLTLTLKNKLQQFDIKVCDYIILSDDNYMSFCDEGVIFKQ